ncbi:hypothetical protein TBR22_A40720 [Luteitalea sp. TBR-22]|uniref:hypothetical protein n=1 Tax=Luteitalea sp. TBR-22 TaxID=2802971 RepID=UPI001AF8954D|nr:hypothetical protein [Luteitalea sp. TBR-22]BCS34846.1 hypothetical protein TBR22_A40720 [Luteitalea sp. TBR-22]
MSRIQHLVAALVLYVALPATSEAQKSTTINIATTISGVAPAAGSEPDPGFLVRSDDGREYVPLTEGKVKTVTNLLIVNQQAATDWSLTLYSLSPTKLVKSSRTVFFDLRYKEASDGVVSPEYSRFFTTPALSEAAGQRLPYGRVTAHLTAKCSEALPAVDFRTMVKDQVAHCPGSLRFLDVDGQWYRFSFQPENFQGVDRFKVTCTATSASLGCINWVITPESATVAGDFSQQGINRLLKIDSGGAIQAVGPLYRVSFTITLRRL